MAHKEQEVLCQILPASRYVHNATMQLTDFLFNFMYLSLTIIKTNNNKCDLSSNADFYRTIDDHHSDHDHSEDTHFDDDHSEDTHSDDAHSDDAHSDDDHSDDAHSDDAHSDDDHSDDDSDLVDAKEHQQVCYSIKTLCKEASSVSTAYIVPAKVSCCLLYNKQYPPAIDVQVGHYFCMDSEV